MKIGIIAAAEDEMLAIKDLMQNISENKIYNLNFISGKINNKECILVKCGVGKVNSARTTQVLIDKYNVACVINVGSAGAVNDELNIGDIVIADKLVQYDFDITLVGDYEKGELCDIGKFITADKNLVNLCKKAISSMENKNFNTKIGTIGSADYFCGDLEKAKQIRKEFNAECVEMEGASIAQVCMLDNIPFLVIRGISDTPNGNNKIDFYTYLKLASKRVAEILKNII